MSIAQLTDFFGWCSLINIILLSLAALGLLLAKQRVIDIHQRWLHLDKEQLDARYFDYLAKYKLAIVVFNLVPYLALQIMA
ncbi:DUF6868 family protein [Aliagarivorans taiwanensis]|uniref:DUF6868 family protein n=1 Tax=Aliagarivorans taiwanensis TaxID=561966 RepID=UPI000411E5F5|nr:hypothetical protein [Aliagarivorans taiwanensis]